MVKLVYLETTVFSFYHDERTAPAVVAMREWTHEWWDRHRHHYALVTPLELMGEVDTP